MKGKSRDDGEQSVLVGTASAKALGQKPVSHMDGGQRKVGLDWESQRENRGGGV